MNKICVIGLGYIGLPTSAILASRGFEVYGIDIKKEIVDTINRGKIHIVEPDLDMLVRSAVVSGKLKAFDKIKPADVFIICVPTPFKQGHKADLSYVIAAAKAIGTVLKKGNLVILESTSPPKTTLMVSDLLKKISGLEPGKDIYVAYCPERVLPGNILKEAVLNDRIIGGINTESSMRAKELYASFVEGNIYLTDSVTAEMTKLVENTYRDINIAYANELSMICDKLGINVWELIKLANKHPRVNVHNPGPGVGGHCIAVDPWFIVDAFPREAQLIKKARERNNAKPDYVVERVLERASQIKNKKVVIGCLGLTYKPNVDDFRESPSLGIVRKLKNKCKVLVNDPYFNQSNIQNRGMDNTILSELINRSDVIVILVGHSHYKGLKLQNKIVLDYCGLLEEEKK